MKTMRETLPPHLPDVLRRARKEGATDAATAIRK